VWFPSNAYVLFVYLHIVKLVKSKRIRWAGHMTSREEKKNTYRIFWGGGNVRLMGFLEDPEV
jgi:hypothetical protein